MEGGRSLLYVCGNFGKIRRQNRLLTIVRDGGGEGGGIVTSLSFKRPSQSGNQCFAADCLLSAESSSQKQKRKSGSFPDGNCCIRDGYLSPHGW